ncbi:hypothetical protein ACFWAR_00580 [Streptomyces sp. NPDC059917]|uniref:hypothetical protein n=1 Tax=Streptomyces sp. NPDC059917 TaxID=3347002 RepID=UPI003655D4B1
MTTADDTGSPVPLPIRSAGEEWKMAEASRTSQGHLLRMEQGLSAVPTHSLEELLGQYGRGDAQGLADAQVIQQQAAREEVLDTGAYAEDRLRALEASAVQITALTYWTSPPFLHRAPTLIPTSRRGKSCRTHGHAPPARSPSSSRNPS